MQATPQFLVLSEAECRALLARHHVGRLAFLYDGTVDIQPVGYVLRGDWIVMRSGYGSKIAAIEQHPYVAFEIDEVRGPFEWESVVVRGTIYELRESGGPVERLEFEKSVEALQAAMPATMGPGDPTPHRDIVYALRIDRISGRGATLDPRDARPRVAAPPHRPGRPYDGF